MALGEHQTPWFRRPITCVLAFAAILRVAYLSAYVVKLPFAYGPVGDSVVYLLQARQIAHGVFGTPAQLAFSPLYGYVLALLTRGEPSLLPIVLQLALGVLNVGLTYKLARRFFDERAAVTSALLMVGYAALLFLESKLLTETLGLTLALSGMLAFCPGREGRSAASALAAGGLLALAVLMRASLLFCLPLFVLCGLPASGQPPAASLRERARRAALLALGAALVLTANGLWNLSHTGLFVPVILVSSTLEKSTQGHWNGSILSYGSADKIPSPFDVVEQAAQRLANPGSAGPGLIERLTHFDALGFLYGMPGKLLETFQTRETFHEYGFLGERDTLPILHALPTSFSVLAVLAALGALAMVRAGRARELWLLLPPVLGTLVTTTLFHPSSRYRLPMILALLPLAGHGVWETLRGSGRLHRYVLVATIAVVLGLTYQFTTRSLGNRPGWLLELAHSSLKAGELEAAHGYAIEAAREAPRDPIVQRRSTALLRAIAQGQQARAGTPSSRPP